jgi:hypothetical protein
MLRAIVLSSGDWCARSADLTAQFEHAPLQRFKGLIDLRRITLCTEFDMTARTALTH